MIEAWKKYLETQEYAPYTIDLYGNAVKELLQFANADATRVSPEMVEQWMLAHKDWGGSTRKWHYAAVKKFFQYCVDKHVISESPADILPTVPTRKHIDESAEDDKENRVYSPADLKAMIDYNPRDRKMLIRDRAIIALMAATGMRASEVSWLNVGQYKNRKGDTIFALRKGQSIRKIVVAAFAFPYVDAYLAGRDCDDEAPLFLTERGNRIDRKTIYHLLKTRQNALGLRTGTHNMRYTVLNAIERNSNPVVARDIAGQKSISITNNYLVSNSEERSEAIASLPWAEIL